MKTLVLGGVKSGKSRFAEDLAASISESVTLIATATVMDDEMAARIARHQEDRPPTWRTIEEPIELGRALLSIEQPDIVVIDCLTLWLTNLLMHSDANKLNQELDAFEAAVCAIKYTIILVSNETTMGNVPLGD